MVECQSKKAGSYPGTNIFLSNILIKEMEVNKNLGLRWSGLERNLKNLVSYNSVESSASTTFSSNTRNSTPRGGILYIYATARSFSFSNSKRIGL